MIESTSILKLGDRVRIVSKWDEYGRCDQNNSGKMDHWLGQIMTVRHAEYGSCRMFEDENEHGGVGWSWNKYCIEEIIPPDYTDESETVSEEDYLSVLVCSLEGGGAL